MYETYWLVLVAAGVLTTAAAIWGPDPPVTVYASLFALGIWIAVGNGATGLVATSGGVELGPYQSRSVQILAYGQALMMLVPLFVGLYEWAVEEDPDEPDLSDARMRDIEDATNP